MKITKILLTNFRSFQNTQTIELAPVTLLFGPNSVGKSSVLMALAYVQQILKHGHCNPQKLEALGNKKIGGFRSLVFGQNTKSSIKIRLEFESGSTPFIDYDSGLDEMSNYLNVDYLLMKDFAGSIKNGGIELEVCWSNRHQYGYVKNYRVWINDAYIGCIASSPDCRNTVIRELNSFHPLLIPYNHDDWLEYNFGDEKENAPFEEDYIHTEFEEVLDRLNPNPIDTANEADVDGAGTHFKNFIAPIAIVCNNGAIPILGRPVSTYLAGQEFEDQSDHFNFLALKQTLSQAFVLPLDKILEHLDKSVFIGPLRVVPDIDYIPNPHPEQHDWVDGSAAWDLLHKNPISDDPIKKLLRQTSDWLSSENKLDTGYEVINQSLSDSLEQKNSIIPAIDGLMKKRHLLFREIRTNIDLSANQLGTGISQVLPIVVAANYDSVELITVEQPELHIHPRMQVELADLLVSARDKHSFLIETHSEHLILRLLKRIRQSTDKELPEGIKAVDGNDICIVYLEPSKSGVIAKRIHIDEDGEFCGQWPQGFFIERREELM